MDPDIVDDNIESKIVHGLHNYYLEENDEIIAFADWKFSEDAIETDKDLARGSDGKIYFIEDIPKATLEDLKKQKYEELSSIYVEYDKNGSVMTSFGFPIQIGQEHCTKLDGAIRFAEMTNQSEIYITDSNNVTHYNISLSTAKLVLIEQMSAALSAHQKKQALRQAINDATSINDLNMIDINFCT